MSFIIFFFLLEKSEIIYTKNFKFKKCKNLKKKKKKYIYIYIYNNNIKIYYLSSI